MARKPSQICITGTGRIRTYVERIQQIYNLSPLTTQPLSHSNIILLVFCSRLIIKKVLPCIHPFSCIPSKRDTYYLKRYTFCVVALPAPFRRDTRKGVKRKVFLFLKEDKIFEGIQQKGKDTKKFGLPHTLYPFLFLLFLYQNNKK